MDYFKYASNNLQVAQHHKIKCETRLNCNGSRCLSWWKRIDNRKTLKITFHENPRKYWKGKFKRGKWKWIKGIKFCYKVNLLSWSWGASSDLRPAGFQPKFNSAVMFQLSKHSDSKDKPSYYEWQREFPRTGEEQNHPFLYIRADRKMIKIL